MFERIAIQLIDTKLEVLIIATLFITLPANIVLSITAAAYLVQITDHSFLSTMILMLIPTVVMPILAGLILVYPIELKIIRSRPNTSLKWAIIRVLWMIVASIPIGVLIFLSTRLIADDYVPIIPRIREIYIVSAIIEALMIGIVTTFFERVFAELVKREKNLKQQIEELRIEIDQGKKKQDVTEITESELFQDLQTRARNMRRQYVK